MYIKKDGDQIIDNTDLLTVQDGIGICIRSGILYYYKGMPVYLLININMQLNMVNIAEILVFGVIPNLQDNTQLFDLSNFINCFSFLYTAR